MRTCRTVPLRVPKLFSGIALLHYLILWSNFSKHKNSSLLKDFVSTSWKSLLKLGTGKKKKFLRNLSITFMIEKYDSCYLSICLHHLFFPYRCKSQGGGKLCCTYSMALAQHVFSQPHRNRPRYCTSGKSSSIFLLSTWISLLHIWRPIDGLFYLSVGGTAHTAPPHMHHLYDPAFDRTQLSNDSVE